MATPQDIRKITFEEYIEANGGLASFLEELNTFAKSNGLDWTHELQQMMSDVEYRARHSQGRREPQDYKIAQSGRDE